MHIYDCIIHLSPRFLYMSATMKANARGLSALRLRSFSTAIAVFRHCDCGLSGRPPCGGRSYFVQKTVVPCTGDDFLKHRGRLENVFA